MFLNVYFHPSNLDSLPADLDNEPGILSVEGKRTYALNKKFENWA